MKVTARIKYLKKVPTDRFLGIASIQIDDCITIDNVAVINSKDGIFASMPQRSYTTKDGQTRYCNVVYSTTPEMKDAFNKAVRRAFADYLYAKYQKSNLSRYCEYMTNNYKTASFDDISIDFSCLEELIKYLLIVSEQQSAL